MITENLSTLQIHKLSQEQYNREFEAGRLNEQAIYLTPEEEIDLSKYLPCYTSLSDLGLTAPTTTEQVCSAMPVNSMLIMGASQTNITDLPESFGTLKIVRAAWNYCTASFSQSNSTTVILYKGKYTTNITPNWTGWQRVFLQSNGADMYFIHPSGDNSYRTMIYGGDGWSNGSSLYLYGKDYQNYQGSFSLRAYDGTTRRYLDGKADGTLTWDNKNIFGEHNKPSGSYVGDGSSNRTGISIGMSKTLGNVVYIYASDYSYQGFALRGAQGIAWSTPSSIVSSGVSCVDGALYFSGTTLNQSGKTYYYQVL